MGKDNNPYPIMYPEKGIRMGNGPFFLIQKIPAAGINRMTKKD